MSVYLVSAYAILWALTFILVFSMWVRQRRLEREIAALQARLEADGGAPGPDLSGSENR
jgi:CcmD family protein